MIDWIAAALCIGGALVALESRQLMRGLLGLTAFFLGVAVFFGLMGAWFLAIGQVLLFVGGVVTLLALAFNIVTPSPGHAPVRGAWLLALALAALLASAAGGAFLAPAMPLAELADAFFSTYGLALQAGLLLLLSAVIGARYLMEEEA